MDEQVPVLQTRTWPKVLLRTAVVIVAGSAIIGLAAYAMHVPRGTRRRPDNRIQPTIWALASNPERPGYGAGGELPRIQDQFILVESRLLWLFVLVGIPQRHGGFCIKDRVFP